MKFEKIKAGDVLYDVHSYRMGNTTLRTMGSWIVRIIEMLPDGAMVSWNGNRPKKYFRRDLERLRAKEPEFITGAFGQQRIKPRTKKVVTP